MERLVSFVSELSADDQRRLRAAGFVVHPNAVTSSRAYWVGAEAPPADWKTRHYVKLDSADDEDALRQVTAVLGRKLDDPVVVPTRR